MDKTQPEQRGPGRPALPEDEKAVPGSIRLTPTRWAKLRRLGAAWLSKAIDRAKE
ncbi:MAG: hypothetical protein GX886_07210 [Comamonadaceae bacterium]|jgi:hypothetical protein|nr:hypothetical protein [Comamonadaceae bacterium]